jgi:hypothetical protein
MMSDSSRKDYIPPEVHYKLQRSFDRLVEWWLAAERELYDLKAK